MKKVKLPGELPTRKRLVDMLDEATRRLVKLRDGWKCVRCGKQHEEGSRYLQCSHFWPRANYGTRWDLDNCDSLCASVFVTKGGRTMLLSCHGIWEAERAGEYRDFKLKQLGQQKYDLLHMRAHSNPHFSRSDLSLLLNDLKEELIIKHH